MKPSAGRRRRTSALMLLWCGMMGCASVPVRQPPLGGVVAQRLWQNACRRQEFRRQLQARLRVRLVGVAGWGGQSDWDVLAQRGGRLLLARRSVLTQPDLVVTADGTRVCVRDPAGCVCRSAVSPNNSEGSSVILHERSLLCHPERRGSGVKDLPNPAQRGEILPRHSFAVAQDMARQDDRRGYHDAQNDGKDPQDDRTEAFAWSRVFPLAMTPAEVSSALLGILPVLPADAADESGSANACEVETVATDRRGRLASLRLSCPRQGGYAKATVRLSDGALLRYERFDRTGRRRYRVRYEEIQQQGGLPLARRVRLWSRWQGRGVRLIVHLDQALLNGLPPPVSVFNPAR